VRDEEELVPTPANSLDASDDAYESSDDGSDSPLEVRLATDARKSGEGEKKGDQFRRRQKEWRKATVRRGRRAEGGGERKGLSDSRVLLMQRLESLELHIISSVGQRVHETLKEANRSDDLVVVANLLKWGHTEQERMSGQPLEVAQCRKEEARRSSDEPGRENL